MNHYPGKQRGPLGDFNTAEQHRLSGEAYSSRTSLIRAVHQRILIAYTLESEEGSKRIFTEFARADANLANDAFGQNNCLSIILDTEDDTTYKRIALYMPVSDEFFQKYADFSTLGNNDELEDMLAREDPDAVIVQRISCDGSEETSDIRRVSPSGTVDYRIFDDKTLDSVIDGVVEFASRYGQDIDTMPEIVDNPKNIEPPPYWLHRSSDADDIRYATRVREDLLRYSIVTRKHISGKED